MNQPRPKPPTFALWLLQRFLAAERHETLVGDLLEKYHQGRSSRWFWREVLIAIVFSLGATLRIRRAEVAFAVIGAVLQGIWWTTLWWKIVRRSHIIQSLYEWGVDWPFPLCSAYDVLFHSLLQLAILLPLMAVFFSFKGGWRGARFLRTIEIGLALLTPGDLLVLLFPRSYYYLLTSVLFFFALLLSIAANRTPRPSVQPPSALI